MYMCMYMDVYIHMYICEVYIHKAYISKKNTSWCSRRPPRAPNPEPGTPNPENPRPYTLHPAT